MRFQSCGASANSTHLVRTCRRVRSLWAAVLVLHSSSATAPSLPAQVTYGRSWDAVWITPREVVEEGLLVSPRMFTDHLGGTLNEALRVRPHLMDPECLMSHVLRVSLS